VSNELKIATRLAIISLNGIAVVKIVPEAGGHYNFNLPHVSFLSV
jgi:hypothetical protein